MALAALSLSAGCAEVAAELTGDVLSACLEIGARAACATLCDDDEDTETDEELPEDVPAPRPEPPPPEWQPAVADCELQRDESGVRVDCAGGTRARFTVDAELVVVAPDFPRGPTVRGPVELREPVDVGLLAGTRAIDGSLVVSSPELVMLVAPELQSIGGDLVISRANALESLALPALARVGGSVIITDNPRLSQRAAEELVFRLTRHGFAGPVEVAGNAPPAP